MKNRVFVFAVIVTTFLLANTAEADVRKPVRITTKNGMTALLIQRSAIPFITVSVAVKAGSVNAPAGLAGLANITAGLLTEGTKTRKATRISEEIDFIGGELSSSGGIDFATASLKLLSKDREKGFDLLADILINPSFPPEEIERAKGRIKAGIISKKDDPSTIAAEAFNKILFGNHPYSRPADGYLESLERIKREQIVRFHSSYYRPGNTVMAVVGDIDKAELTRLLDEYFGKWEGKKSPTPEYAKAKGLTKRTVKVIDKKISQASIQIGHLGLKRSNPDFYAAYVMNYIFGGGGFVSRLMTEIRDNRGLVYGIYSYFNPLKEVGPFRVSLQTKNESAIEAIKETLRQLREMVKKGVTEEELRDAKDYIIGSFPLKFTTNKKIASYLTYIEIYGLGLDYLERFPKIIERLGVEDINRVAKKYLDPENYLLVVVGDGEKLGELE